MTHSAPDVYREPADLPWGTRANGEFTRQGATLASIMGTCAVFFSLPLGILGIILSNTGLNRIQTQPERARRFLLWSWITFIPGTAVGAFFAVSVLAWALGEVV